MRATLNGTPESKHRYFVSRVQQEEILNLYAQGKSKVEIARYVGRSPTTVGTIIYRHNHAKLTYKRLEQMCARIVYPGLRKWFFDSGASYEEAGSVIGVSARTLGDWLRGWNRRADKRADNIPKWAIDGLLEWTGLTYEQAFREEDIEDE